VLARAGRVAGFGRGPSEHVKKRLVAASVTAAEQLSARGIAGGAADGAVGVASRYSRSRRMMSSDAQVAARMRPHRRSSGPPIPRDGPKHVGPILVVKAHRHQKGGNRRIAVVHVARAAQQRLLPTVPIPLAAIDAALMPNRVGESVDRFCQLPRECVRGRWASRQLRGSSPRRRSRQPVARRRVIGRAFHAQHGASARTSSPQNCGPNGQTGVVTCPSSRRECCSPRGRGEWRPLQDAVDARGAATP
jgi:hypothetical protein